MYEAVRKQEQCYKNNLNSVRTQQETEEIIIKQRKTILHLKLENENLQEENRRLREQNSRIRDEKGMEK